MKRGFTLVEMLVVIGIIAILLGTSVMGFSRMTKSAERAKAQELVSNVATALTALFQAEGSWPKRLATRGGTDGLLDQDVALVLAKGGYISLTTDADKTKLDGLDQFGIVSPWASLAIKAAGTGASLGTRVGNSDKTVQDHILHFALDLDGDGIIQGANVGGKSVDIRATAAVWCGGKDGVIAPYPYGSGGSGGKGQSGQANGQRSDDVWSWSVGQTQDVK